MAAIDLTKENFEETINNNDIVLLDFWAEWCGPCKSFKPVFEAAAEKYPDIVFAKIDTEAEQELAAMFQIRSIPTLMAFREKVVIFSQPGALQASQLEQLIEQIKDLDMDQVRKEIEEQQNQQQENA
ncbi:MAG: thioredoxin [Gammaproteobacteria bacterium]|nr:thioredoxin [Gammaproteobacteria bacterium]